jgi:hypothetical protein
MKKELGRKSFRVATWTRFVNKNTTETLVIRDFTGRKEFRFNEPLQKVHER